MKNFVVRDTNICLDELEVSGEAMATVGVLQPNRSDAGGLLSGGQLGSRFYHLFEAPSQEPARYTEFTPAPLVSSSRKRSVFSILI